MEKRLLKYTIIIIIFFIGLSMGVSYQDNRSARLQTTLSSFEDEISTPNHDFEPVNPYDNESNSPIYPTKINHNIFTSLAKDGEYLLKKGLELILDKTDDLIRLIFGIK